MGKAHISMHRNARIPRLWYLEAEHLPRDPGARQSRGGPDFATFFGLDLRRLAADGAPTENLYATDIEGLFWNLGYDLFRDADRFKATFIEADALDVSRTTSPILSNPKLLGKLSIIHSSHFLHLFPREDTLTLICDVFLPLLNLDGPGAWIVGRNAGRKEARLVKTLVQPQSTRVFLFL